MRIEKVTRPQQIATVLRQYLEESGLDNIQEILDSIPLSLATGTVAWVAVLDDKVAGCVVARPRGEITRLYVLPEYRDRRIGTMLRRVAEDHGAWWATVSENNHKVIKWLASYGYTLVGYKAPGYFMMVLPDKTTDTAL